MFKMLQNIDIHRTSVKKSVDLFSILNIKGKLVNYV